MASKAEEFRAEPRFVIERDVDLHLQCGSTLTARLVELSRSGCRISEVGQSGLKSSEIVTLLFHRSLMLEASVRWCSHGFAGMRLLRPLHEAELDALVALSRSWRQAGGS